MGIFDRFRRKKKSVDAEPASLESQADKLDDGLISLDEFEEWESEQLGAKFKQGLEKSRENFQNKLNDLMSRHRKVDEDFSKR